MLRASIASPISGALVPTARFNHSRPCVVAPNGHDPGVTPDRPTASHAPFAVFNRIGNPSLKLVLRSPAHRLASGRLCLISVTGRRSGRTFTFPVAYSRTDAGVRIAVGWPERKRWWRNLR